MCRAYLRELFAIVASCPDELLTFAQQYSNSTSELFPSYAPPIMPTLESLCCHIYSPFKLLHSPPSCSNNFFFYVMCYPRDISRLTIRKLCEEYYEEAFKDESKTSKFTVCYHRDKNIKECLLPSAYNSSLLNKNISKYFKKFYENTQNRE